MTDELKWGMLVSFCLLSALFSILYAYDKARQRDLESPVVKTCIEHPVTVSPFKGNY